MAQLMALALLAISLLLNVQIALAVTSDDILKAFNQDKVVQSEIRKLEADGRGDQKEYDVVDLGGSCGVVGCYFQSLVIMRITSAGANPQTSSILARVDGLNGKITGVSLVELSTKTSKSRLQVQKRYPALKPLEPTR
jgi:hypothetical protein